MQFDAQELEQALRDFQAHLRSVEMKESAQEHRMRGAREFARFLLGRPHELREVTKGRPL